MVSDIQFIEALVRNSGMHLESVLDELNLPEGLFDRPRSNYIAFADYIRLFQRITETTGDETCSASSRQLRNGTSHYLLDTLPDQIDLRGAMKHLAKGYNVVHAGEFNRVIETTNRISYCVDDRGFPYASHILEADSHAFMESIILSMHFLFCRLTGEELSSRILRIKTRRKETPKRSSFLQYWNAPIIYGADCHAVEYDGRVSQFKVRNIDNTRVTNVFEFGFRDDLLDSNDPPPNTSLTSRIEQFLMVQSYTQTFVARHLGMSVATMRRRLKQESTSFRTIRANVLNERARRLISRGEHIESVARALGFSDFRSFSRAFVAWNKVTPTAYRRQSLN